MDSTSTCLSANYYNRNDYSTISSTMITDSTTESNVQKINLVADSREQQPVHESFSDKLNRTIPGFGLWMALLSVFCFSIASLIVKILTELHPLEILAIRSTIQILFYLTATLYFRLPFFGLPGHRFDIFLRCIFGCTSAICIYMAYRLIPLADASTIQFSDSFLVFILAYFILGERITLWHWLSGFLALTGVIFVSKPKFIWQFFDEAIVNQINYYGITLAIVSALATAVANITLRKLKQTPVYVIILWFSIASTITSSVALYFIDKFQYPTGIKTWTLLCVIGFCGIGNHLFVTLAFKYESAGIVSVFRTLNIVLAFVWDLLLFNISFHWTSFIGSLLVSISVISLSVLKSR